MIEYKGDGIPVDPEQLVVCKLRCGLITKTVKASVFDWVHGNTGTRRDRVDVVAYELV